MLVLLTDGINNAGEVDPITAAYATKAMGIKVYTIGVGSTKNAPFPIDDPVLGKRYVTVPVQIDEEGLQSIAQITRGRYFRATDTKKLEEIYKRNHEALKKIAKENLEKEMKINKQEILLEELISQHDQLEVSVVSANNLIRGHAESPRGYKKQNR